MSKKSTQLEQSLELAKLSHISRDITTEAGELNKILTFFNGHDSHLMLVDWYDDNDSTVELVFIIRQGGSCHGASMSLDDVRSLHGFIEASLESLSSVTDVSRANELKISFDNLDFVLNVPFVTSPHAWVTVGNVSFALNAVNLEHFIETVSVSAG